MLFLLGCAPDCPAGSDLAEDGTCTALIETDAVPGFDDVLEALPACTTPKGSGRIDLEELCAHETCAGDSYAEVRAGLGEGECLVWMESADGSHGFLGCQWAVGIGSFFPALPDENDWYIPDLDAPTGWPLWLDPAYTGLTSDGLGPSSELACWLDALGPAELSIHLDEEEPYVWGAWWPDLGVHVYENGEWDGRGWRYLVGAPYNVTLGREE